MKRRPAAASQRERKIDRSKLCAVPAAPSPDMRGFAQVRNLQTLAPWFRINFPTLSECHASKQRAFVEQLFSKGWGGISRVQISQQTGLDPRSLRTIWQVAGMGCLLWDRDLRDRAEGSVAMSKVDAHLQYLDIDQADETPMPVARREYAGKPVDSGGSHLVPISDTSSIATFKLDVGKLNTKATVQQTKILQSRSGYSMLTRTGDTYNIVCGTTLNPLQHVERTTSEVLVEAVRRRSAISPHISVFEDHVRIVAEDSAPSNFKAERHTCVDRPDDWDTIESACEGHLDALCLKGYSKDIEVGVSGQIHWALSMKASLLGT